jgi:NTP pyrophosphatase (non-canonical NTP hydrolase)
MQTMPMKIEQLVQAELARAVAKFPTWPTDPLHALAVLGEEFGELTKAMLQHTYEPHKGVTAEDIRNEAIQTAAMALRLAMSLPCYQYRKAPQHSQGSDNLPDDYEV